MMEWADQWPDARSLSSSNPEPFTLDELSQITGDDWSHLPLNSMDYQSAAGDVGLRERMNQHLYPDCHPDDLILCAGAQEALFVAFQALLNPGDHVVTFSPTFEPLTLMPEQIGARITTLPLSAENQWQPNLEQLEAAVMDNAQLLVINFPHNPTGAHIDSKTFEHIIACCEKYGVRLLSDEVFRGLEHDASHLLPAAADVFTSAVSVGVMSKAYALPAIRIGWILCRDPKLRQRMISIKNHLSICISGIDANCLHRLLPHQQSLLDRSVAIINQNKSWLKKQLEQHSNMSCTLGTAAATCFINVPNDAAFCAAVAEETQTSLLPGHCFASKNSGFRLSLGYRSMIKDSQRWLGMSQ